MVHCWLTMPKNQWISRVFIQALRAFRRAEVIVHAVLFESCVTGVAVAVTVASICHLDFWFLWDVVLGAFLDGF